MSGADAPAAVGVPAVDVPAVVVERMVELGAPESLAQAPVYRALASQPDLLRGWIELSWSLRMRSGSARRLREMVIVRMAVLAEASFVYDAHAEMARAQGVSETELEALSGPVVADVFPLEERAALALADEIHRGTVSDDTLRALAEHYPPAERVELIVTCAFYVMVPRVNNALRVG